MPAPGIQPIVVTCQTAASSGVSWTAISTIIVSLAALFSTGAIGFWQAKIAFGQKIISEEKLISELFERRYEVYESLWNMLHFVFVSADDEDFAENIKYDLVFSEVLVRVNEQLMSIQNIRFLFSEELYDYVYDRLMEIKICAIERMSILLEEPTSDLSPGTDAHRAKGATAGPDTWAKLNREFRLALPDHFRRYLAIRNFRQVDA